MEWIRGERIGHGSFGTVSLAIPRSENCQNHPLMAVKSCGVTHSASLMNEKVILDELRGCPEIVSCFGDNYSYENGDKLYNVLLEFASGGSLADKVTNSGDHQFPEFEVRRYTKSILRGLEFIHKNGYVHCDIKLQNILLGQNDEVKIADFGLAKRVVDIQEGDLGCELRGTPMYMSPEMATGGDQNSPADIWALGCVVAEMVTGSPAWRCSDMAGLLMKIGVGEEIPEIPGKLSEEGKDFLEKCFVKDPRKRWTAEMLLNHPFVIDHDTNVNLPSTSPRCALDFPDWVSEITFSPSSSPDFDFDSDSGSSGYEGLLWSTSPEERLNGLICDQRPDWSIVVEDDWVTVR